MNSCIYEHKVQFYETDKMGITHHSNYIRWMEEARMYYFEQCGTEYTELEKCGIHSPVVSVDCRYKSPSTYADVVRVEVRLDYFNGVRIRFGYAIRSKLGMLLAEGSTEHCFVNEAGTVLNMKKAQPGFYRALSAPDKT